MHIHQTYASVKERKRKSEFKIELNEQIILNENSSI